MTTTTTQRSVVISGAAGHLGRAVAQAYLQRGDRVTLLDRHASKLNAEFHGNDRVVLCEIDLMDRDAVRSGFVQASKAFERVDTICHLAGGFHMGRAVHDIDVDGWTSLMALNATSLIHMAAAGVPHLKAAGGGAIVTVGAGSAQRGAALMGAYCASKSALMRLTESMSAELKDEQVNVNCVLPSIIDTADNRAAMPGADFDRWVSPTALAEVILFLTSDASRAIHGAAIPVTGRL